MLAAVAFALQVAASPASDATCAAEREAQRRAWSVTGPARAQPQTTEGRTVRHLPTARLGAWVVETVGADSASLTLVTRDNATRVTWDSGCTASRETRPRAQATSPRFTDADLDARVRSGRAGVIYLWSPHMPLSVDAFAALVEAASARGLAVDVVLDPAADRAFASRVATARGLPADAGRVADSIELQFRDVLLHAPTVQAYAGGRLVGPPFPGGHTAAEYGAYLDRVLNER